MAQALDLARLGQGAVAPNPLVGALLCDAQGKVLAQGFHRCFGGPHAEVECLSAFAQVPPQATLFVTLEPCSHTGKTPPCVDLLLQKQVKQVVVGQLDPNPLVAGQGVARLRQAGVEVLVGCREAECRELNRFFNFHITAQRPWITFKTAITLDGKIATQAGESQWITGEPARAHGHEQRSLHQGIMVGKNTLLADNPRLTDRVSKLPCQPQPIVAASRFEVHPQLHLFSDSRPQFWLVKQIHGEDEKRALDYGIILLPTGGDLAAGLRLLYQRQIGSVLVEGGGKLAASLVKAGLVEELLIYLAPRLLGQPTAPGWMGDLGLQALAETPWFNLKEQQPLGQDLLLRYQKAPCLPA